MGPGALPPRPTFQGSPGRSTRRVWSSWGSARSPKVVVVVVGCTLGEDPPEAEWRTRAAERRGNWEFRVCRHAKLGAGRPAEGGRQREGGEGGPVPARGYAAHWGVQTRGSLVGPAAGPALAARGSSRALRLAYHDAAPQGPALLRVAPPLTSRAAWGLKEGPTCKPAVTAHRGRSCESGCPGPQQGRVTDKEHLSRGFKQELEGSISD